MKKSLNIIAVLSLMLLWYSCGGRAIFNNQLLRADSFIVSHSDSSWQILRKIDIKSLDDLNMAYYNLLYTESGYKSFKPITGDSMISVAEDYFDKNQEKYPDLYARSVLYKGCVNEELKNEISAMRMYVKAKDLSQNIDDYTYGYSLFRIASLYQDQYLMGDTAISYYKRALQSFKKCGCKHLQRACLGEIGRLYRAQNSDSVYKYMCEAIKLAKELNDDYRVACYNTILAGYYYWENRNVEAKNVAMFNIRKYAKYLKTPDCYCFVALSYANLGNADSAKIMLNQLPKVRVKEDSLLIYSAKAKYYRLVKQFDKSLEAYERGDELRDSMLIHSLRSELMEMGKKTEVGSLKIEKEKVYIKYYSVCICMFVFIVLLLLSVVIIQRLRNKYTLALQEMDSVKSDLNDTLNKISYIEQELSATKRTDIELKDMLGNQMSSVKELIELSNEYESRPEIFMRKFRQAMTISEDNTYWIDLFGYINSKYDNLMDKIRLMHPELTQLELNFISLMCCELSNTVIMVCMSYKNIKSVYNKKILIAKKCGEKDLSDYLRRLKCNNNVQSDG